MTFEKALREELSLPLPGKDFQLKNAPFNRPDIRIVSARGIEAAVSLIILKKNHEYSVVLMKRPEYNGHHSGQVSFPGGKKEPQDKSLIDTAIRETYEEIGICLDINEFSGALSPLYIQVSGFRVIPYIFFLQNDVTFVLNNKEAEYIFFASIKDIIDESTLKRIQFSVSGYFIDTPYFDLENEIVWGATSMILSEFKEILLRVKRKNPGII